MVKPSVSWVSKDSETNDITRWDFSVMAAKTYVGNLRDNVRRSMKYNLEHGRWQHYAPLAYINIRDAEGHADVVLDSLRAPMVKLLFEKYATGNYSLSTLTDLAKDIGLTARRKNQSVSKNSIRTLLTNPFYYGVMKEKNKIYTHNHPRLIEKALFDKVQDVLAGRNKSPTKMSYRERDFITRGVIKCTCGCAITPEYHRKPSGKEYVYLKCSHFHKECHQQGLNENIILEQFKNEIFKKMFMPEHLRKKIKQEVRQQIEKDDVLNINLRKSTETRLTILKESYNRLLDLYIQGSITQEVYNTKKAAIELEHEELTQQLHKYQNKDTNINNVSEIIVDLAGNALNIFMSSKPDERNQFLKLLVSNCVLDNKKARICLAKPFDLLLKTPSCLMWSD
ncbi:MAG: recombinase family protein [Alphaproteobacteria bacterium]|nr:recombinase family protein [Alphaproteobacteria bacterium]